MLNLVTAGFGIAAIPQDMKMMMPDGLIYRPLNDDDSLARSALVLPLQATALAQKFAAILASESTRLQSILGNEEKARLGQ